MTENEKTVSDIKSQICNEYNEWNLRNDKVIEMLDIFKNDDRITDLHNLLLEGFPIDSTNEFGYTMLHLAAERDLLDYVQVLLYHGADTTATSYIGKTPLMVAVQQYHVFIIEELWPYLDKYEINKTMSNGYTLLMLLLQNHRLVDYAVDLLEMDPNVNQIARDRKSALYLSFHMPDARCFNAIFSRVTDPDVFYGILLPLFRSCRFHCQKEFTDTLYTVLESPHIRSIISSYNKINVIEDWCNYYNYSAISFLLNNDRNLSKDDFMKVLYVFLSYGAKVKSIDFWVILNSDCKYKFDVMPIIIDLSTHYIPLLSERALFPFHNYEELKYTIRYTDSTVKHVVHKLFAEYYSRGRYFPAQETLILLQYTAGSRQLCDIFFEYSSSVVDKFDREGVLIMKIERVLAAKRVPSLLELCRDTVRQKLVEISKFTNINKTVTKKDQFSVYFGDSKYGLKYFLRSVEKLDIPRRLKDIVLHATPIYNNDDT